MNHIKNLLCFITVVTIVASGLLFQSTVETKAQSCVLTIEKEATPSDGTEFDFTCSGGFFGDCNGNPNFTLANGDERFLSLTPSGDFSETVIEDVPEGWRLDNIDCVVNSGNPNNISFDLNAVENGVVVDCLNVRVRAVCTFSNVRACDVTIGKTALPDDGTIFDFSAPGSTEPEFTLTNGEEIEIQVSAGDDVDVTEILPLEWRLNNVECSNADGVLATDIENGVNLACGPNGGSVECNFANTNIRNIPTMSEWGLIVMAAILGIFGILYYQRKRKVSH